MPYSVCYTIPEEKQVGWEFKYFLQVVCQRNSLDVIVVK